MAIAGVLAMLPEAIIFDEATAMLDPQGRKDVFETVQRLNRQKGLTVIWITHYMEEAALADHVFIMHNGSVVMEGTPGSVFSDGKKLEEYRLRQPVMTRLAQKLREKGFDLPTEILTEEDMAREVIKCRSSLTK